MENCETTKSRDYQDKLGECFPWEMGVRNKRRNPSERYWEGQECQEGILKGTLLCLVQIPPLPSSHPALGMGYLKDYDCFSWSCFLLLLLFFFFFFNKQHPGTWPLLFIFQNCIIYFKFYLFKLLKCKINKYNCGVGEDSWESLGLYRDQTSQS